MRIYWQLYEKMSVDSARKSNVNVLKIRIFPRAADLISPFMTMVKHRIFPFILLLILL